MKSIRLVLAGLLALAITGTIGGTAQANDRDIIREGACSANSDWKLKLSPENDRLEIEFEIDQNVVGDTWRVTLHRNGTLIFRGQRTTQAPSGSFEVRRVVADPAGADTVIGRAVNLRTGESCRGSATSDF